MPEGIIGRGENRTVEILKYIFPEHDIYQQYPLKSLITHSEFLNLGKEHSQHLHDIVLKKDFETIVIEVNYKHGDIAEAKWNNVYKPLLEDAGCITGTIEDSECESLFELSPVNEHNPDWQDWIDVIGCLKASGIQEPLNDD